MEFTHFIDKMNEMLQIQISIFGTSSRKEKTPFLRLKKNSSLEELDFLLIANRIWEGSEFYENYLSESVNFCNPAYTINIRITNMTEYNPHVMVKSP